MKNSDIGNIEHRPETNKTEIQHRFLRSISSPGFL